MTIVYPESISNEMKRMSTHRTQISLDAVEDAIEAFRSKLLWRLAEKGFGTFASNHEILGIITQETDEYSDAVHKRLTDEEKIEELYDIAVACVFGAACIKSNTLDW